MRFKFSQHPSCLVSSPSVWRRGRAASVHNSNAHAPAPRSHPTCVRSSAQLILPNHAAHILPAAKLRERPASRRNAPINRDASSAAGTASTNGRRSTCRRGVQRSHPTYRHTNSALGRPDAHSLFCLTMPFARRLS